MQMRTEQQIAEAHSQAMQVCKVRPHGCWQTYVKKSAEPDGQCDRQHCGERATHRIRLNIWGTVGEFDVCERHAHGNCQTCYGRGCDACGQKGYTSESRDGNWCDSV